MWILLIDDEHSLWLEPEKQANWKLRAVEQAVLNAGLGGVATVRRLDHVASADEIASALQEAPDLVLLDVDLRGYQLGPDLDARKLLMHPDLDLLRRQKIVLVTSREKQSDPSFIEETWEAFPFIREYVAMDEIGVRLPDILASELNPETVAPSVQELADEINLPGSPVWYVHDDQTLFEFLSLKKDRKILPIAGTSLKLRSALGDALLISPQDVSVYIHGPSGTGKEALAQLIHSRSRYGASPMEVLDAGSLPSGEGGLAVDVELFGTGSAKQNFHEKNWKGILERIPQGKDGWHRGTLFIDEIGEMPPDTQRRLLRVLQEGTFRRLASTLSDGIVKSAPRIICATDRSLEDLSARSVGSGGFDDALFARVASFTITLPALAERSEDLDLLVQLFSQMTLQEVGVHGRPIRGGRNWPFSEGAIRLMRRYGWPRNIRQLRDSVRILIYLAHARAQSKGDNSERLSVEDAIHISRSDVARRLDRVDRRVSDEPALAVQAAPVNVRTALVQAWVSAVLRVALANEQAVRKMIGDTSVGRTEFLEFCRKQSGQDLDMKEAMEWVLHSRNQFYGGVWFR